MWNITINTAEGDAVTSQEDAVFATTDTDIRIVEPGDWDGDWLAELPDEMVERALSDGEIDEILPSGYQLHISTDKEW